MTHKDNLPSILSRGLLSHNAAHKGGHNARNIANTSVTNIRARKIETVHGRLINDYVPLYFNPKNAMLYVRRQIQNDIVILGVDPTILLEPQSVFTDGNAASGGTRFFNETKQLDQLNWDCIRGPRWSTFADGRRIRCAEVLVYPSISISRVQAVFCNSPATLAAIKPLLNKQPHISLSVDRSHYF